MERDYPSTARLRAMELVCPNSGARLAWTGNGFETPDKRFQYPLVDGMALLFDESLKVTYRLSHDTVQEYYRRVPAQYAQSHHVGLAGARAFMDHLEAKLRRYIKPDDA